MFLFWKKTPFIRLLLPLMMGIVLQWHVQLPALYIFISILFCTVLLFGFFFLSFKNRYKFSQLNGIVSFVLFVSLAALLVWQKDIRNNKIWFGHSYQQTDALLVTLEEQTVEKTKSLKANAHVDYILQNNTCRPVTGTIIIYFNKDSLAQQPGYGTRIILQKPLQLIKNSGNPGAFDYSRYSLFQGITHQVYVKTGEYEILQNKKTDAVHNFLYATKNWILKTLQKNISSAKELGLAEALLIGYKDDLDKTLVQSYTNTGVVHIIAISGLHLGLIYWLLLHLFKPLQKRKRLKWLRPVFIIAGLWLFSLLAGAQPSVLRSAVMFTCIVIGESFSRKSSIYNTMAISAFLLLCYNPFWLWDVGFQLSYGAVLSILIFMKPVYNWFHVKNKVLDFIWKLNAVTIAAQIITLPISIYHFHQFPNYFILTNFLAVPLSSLIIIGEILICIISFIPSAALLVGKITSWFIWLMNTYVERIEAIPYSLWNGLQISIPQMIGLFIFITGTSYWLMEKSKPALKIALISLLFFTLLRSLSFIETNHQQKIIVYNVPQKRAIDFIDGNDYYFSGDSSLLKDDFGRNFHLNPARILYRTKMNNNLPGYHASGNYIDFHSKKILIHDKPLQYSSSALMSKQVIDLLIISNKQKMLPGQLMGAISVKQVVLDGSVPFWQANMWKKDCDSLHIPCHDVSVKGAFVMNLN